MAVEVGTRSSTEGQRRSTADILQAATYALRWNTPEIAEQIQSKLAVRIAELESSMQGTPTQKAEIGNVLAKTRESTRRIRRLGLASGSNEEPSSGMVLAVPINNSAETSPSRHFPNFKDASAFEWWYIPRPDLEQTLTKPGTDKYVSRAVQEFILGSEATIEINPVHAHIVELDPIAMSTLLRVAQFMKANDLQGRIPTRREIIIKDRLHSGELSSSNISRLPHPSALPRSGRATA